MENFSYLEKCVQQSVNDRGLFYAIKVGVEAEKLFIDEHYTPSVVWERKFLENLLRVIKRKTTGKYERRFRRDTLHYKKETQELTLEELIGFFKNELDFKPEHISVLNEMRQEGNEAVHKSDKSRHDALYGLRWAYDIASECIVRYYNPDNFLQKEFVVPERTQTISLSAYLQKEKEMKEREQWFKEKLGYEKERKEYEINEIKSKNEQEIQDIQKQLNEAKYDRIALRSQKELYQDLKQKYGQINQRLEKNFLLLKRNNGDFFKVFCLLVVGVVFSVIQLFTTESLVIIPLVLFLAIGIFICYKANIVLRNLLEEQGYMKKNKYIKNLFLLFSKNKK